MTVCGESIRKVESFVYLGSVIDRQGGTDRDVIARTGKARAVFDIWASGEINTTAKLRLFISNVKSALLYGSKMWSMTKVTQQKIQTFTNTCLRRIFKIWWTDKICNEELWQRAGQEPVTRF
ncbi:hypothetical protein V1264_018818 [Littorina saxatilis]|uniref:DUF6451 domain-containing protein n=1 Tax=Littorina saxatilis TaxID=31220 RepID=A0AAN9GD94_9CAEN